ncbi:DNA helicase [Metamycoplasma hyosynoviae]|uniref:replicative DNA helicase n=1 Tax=Metamycoplasma hyosynoviae TaxID=29559 RepID=UPI000460CBFF|nr:replicative DNA helicase [Metamycoplasma hyosynoviae]KDE43461.1 DNA helicase [Metamycoplasma hyosynoviae]KDE44435.1 DNA helicase [Metamycoplasma hyosynoviae]
MFDKEREEVIANIETSLLGVLIRYPTAYQEIAEVLKSEMFHFKANQKLYETIAEVQLSSEEFDITILLDYINKNKLSSEISFVGMAPIDYLPWLAKNAGYYAELNNYVKKIIDQYKVDKVLNLIESTKTTIQNKPFEIKDLINDLQLQLINIDVSEINTTYTTLYNEANEVVNKIMAQDDATDDVGLKFGYRELDNILLGANPGDLIILAARPSMGKTAFALNIASNVVKESNSKGDRVGNNVLFFSLEMSTNQLVTRILSIQSAIPIFRLRTKTLSKKDWSELRWVKDSMEHQKLYFNDKSSLTISDISTLAKRFAQNNRVDLVIIDYLQLIGTSSKAYNENRQLEVSKISRSLKQLARELKCPVLALSQLSRNVEKREDKMPILSDLRESGTIEQDADIVMFLHRKDYYQHKKSASMTDDSKGDDIEGKQANDDISLTNVIVAKNRHGATGQIVLAFESKTNKFYYENFIKNTVKGEDGDKNY